MTLKCHAATVRVGSKELISSVSTLIAPARVTAILGPNGAGKSTLLAVLAGLRAPDAGKVWLNGRDITRQPSAELARTRAVMQQDSAVSFAFHTRDVVELGRYPHRRFAGRDDEAIASAAMQATGVAHLAERVYQTLSGGEKARAQLARALAQIWQPVAEQGPRWLLLDEPTAALDLAHQHQTLRLARDWAHGQGVGVVVVLHDLNLALRYADDVLLLNAGRLHTQGPTVQTLRPELIGEIWGIACEPAPSSLGVPQFLFS